MAASCSEQHLPEDDSTLVDMMLLLECLKFQKECVPLQKQALGTLASMCQEKASSRDLFRTGGCLEYVANLVKTTTSPAVLQAGLYTLASATESNVVSQMKLSDQEIFCLLTQTLLSHEDPLLHSSAVFLAISLMYNNGQGQNIARETKLLSRLIDVFKCGIPTPSTSSDPSQIRDTDLKTKLWFNSAQAVSVACDNPQNELNQNLCCSAIPAAVSVLTPDRPWDVIKSALTVIIACVSNNMKSQERLHMVGGLKALGRLLRALVKSCTASDQNSPTVVMHVVRCICATTSGNDTNIDFMASMRIVPLLLMILKWPLDTSNLMTTVLCIETLAEQNEAHQKQLVESDGVPLLISIMADSQESVLNKIITVLLQNCVMKKAKSDTPPITHLYSVLDKIMELTDQGLIKLNGGMETVMNRVSPTAPSSVCEEHPRHQQYSRSNASSMENQLQELSSLKQPVKDKVQNWLDQSSDRGMCAVSEDALLKNLNQDRVQSKRSLHPVPCIGLPNPAATDSSTVEQTQQRTATITRVLNRNVGNFASKGTQAQFSETEVASNVTFASESEIQDLKSRLMREEGRRAKIEDRLRELELKLKEQNATRKNSKNYLHQKHILKADQQRSFHTDERHTNTQFVQHQACLSDSSDDEQYINSQLKVNEDHAHNSCSHTEDTAYGLYSLHQDQDSYKALYDTMSVQTGFSKCIGCFGLPGVFLTSRNLFAHLSTTPSTCRYHRKMLTSIFSRTPLVVDHPTCNPTQHVLPQMQSTDCPKNSKKQYSTVQTQWFQAGSGFKEPSTLKVASSRSQKFNQTKIPKPSSSSYSMVKHFTSTLPRSQQKSLVPTTRPTTSTSQSARTIATDGVGVYKRLNEQLHCDSQTEEFGTRLTEQKHSTPLGKKCHSLEVNMPNREDEMVLEQSSDCNWRNDKNTNIIKPATSRSSTTKMRSLKPLEDCTNTTHNTNAGHRLSDCHHSTSNIYEYETPTCGRKRNCTDTSDPHLKKLLKLRRSPLPFTKMEEEFLLEGVKRIGTRWKHILSSYPFQEGRTAMSLKDKHKLLTKYKR